MNLPNKLQEFIAWTKNNRKKFFMSIAVSIALAVGFSGLAVYYFRPGVFYKIIKIGPRYAQGFVLVEDKISQGADIAINVPPFLTKEELKVGLKFEPAIKGAILDTSDTKKILFKPAEVLKLGNYYTAIASTSQGIIGKDFQIVAPPVVESVFPRADSEADENSNITVIFSRPMVALSTLDELEKNALPVNIQPETPGKFKWIGTKTLQFIPDDTLAPSSNYLVTIDRGFVSAEGLKLEGFEQKFITRPLRYESISGVLDLSSNYEGGGSVGALIYNEPIKIYFNQPFDLKRTIEEIYLTGGDGSKFEFIAEYGVKEIFDKRLNKNVKAPDESILQIYNKRDRFGRAKLWDFRSNINFKINKAYPRRGDIILNEAREADFQVTDIIQNVTAESDRSGLVSPELLDPTGKLVLSFYEEIDKEKSKIVSDKITGIVYGEKCKEGVEYSDIVQCEKKIDKSQLIISFDAARISMGEKFEIILDRIYNVTGQKINAEPIKQIIASYPELEILKTIPDKTATSADLTSIIICTNSPLAPLAPQDLHKKNIGQYIKSNLDFEISSWNQPFRVFYNETGIKQCAIGQYETTLWVGFMPEADYHMEFDVKDDFGQSVFFAISFHTGNLSDSAMNFFHFQDHYNVTTPGRTNLTYAAFNMEFVDMTICQLTAEDALNNLNHKINYWQGPSTVKNCLKTVSKRIDLPKKYWIKNYFQVNLADFIPNPLGHYMLTFTNPRYFDGDKKNQVYERTYLTVTNLSLVEKKLQLDSSNYLAIMESGGKLSDKQLLNAKNIYWVTKIDSLEPVANADLELFSSQGTTEQKITRAKTDTKGIAEVRPVDQLDGVIVKSGGDSALIPGSRSSLNSGDTAYSAQMIYLYTDRPIYRPGQTVHFKGIYRVGFDGDYEIFKDKKVPVKVWASDYGLVFDKELDVNDYGTFSGELILDAKAPLGPYRLDAKGSSGFFDVEEYVPAAFKVEAMTDREEYISGDSFRLDVEASYYFGAPVEGGTVEYSIAGQNYYFDKYQGEYFNFGGSSYYCYGAGCYFGDQFILRNSAKLDEQGKGRISEKVDFAKLFKEDNRGSKIFVVFLTVRNSSGQAVSAQKSFIYHAGEFYLGLISDKSFLGKGEEFNLKMKTVDTEGKALGVNNVKVKIDRVNWIYAKRKEVDGGFYYTYEKKLETVSEQTVSTDSGGHWQSKMSLDKEGEYEASAVSQDKRENGVKTVFHIYVYGEGQVEVRPTNDQSLEVIADKSYLDVGNTANIIIKSPFARAKALVSIERGKIFNYDIVDVNQSILEYKFPIKEEYIPSVNTAVVLLSPQPEVKFGYASFSVNSKEKQITITASPDKEIYLPGENVVIKYSAKDSNGRPVATEMSTAVADLSVLALKGNPKKDPVGYFYGFFPLSIMTSSNIKNILYESDLPVSVGKGGGGGEPDDLAKKKRGIFKDTAFWQAVIITDSEGQAESRFTLPDNLTTWQIESLGVTQDTKLGVAYKEFMAKKDVMAVPLAPRFILPGDEFSIGAKIFNQTKNKQSLAVSFTSDTLVARGGTSDKINLAAGETKNVYFKVSSPAAMTDGSHKFTISAKNEEYKDAVEGAVKINRNSTYETVAVADNSDAASATEYVYLPGNVVKDLGGLTINTSATLAVYLPEALNYLLEYPYGCSEQIASKLNALAVVKKSLAIENIGGKVKLKEIEINGNKYTQEQAVDLGLNEIYKTYLPAQGFAYYAGGLPNFYLTLYIADVLNNLKRAGYSVRGDVYNELPGIIQQNFMFMPDYEKDENLAILTAYTLSKFSQFTINQTIIDKIKELEKNDKYINEKASNMALVELSLLLAEKKYGFSKKFQDKIFEILDNRIEIDARGAFLRPNGNLIWQYYENPTKNTALFLKVLAAGKKENKVTDRLLRWLLSSRSKDGAWETTNNTLAVIDALAEYLSWKQENKSEFSLKVLLNNNEKASYSWGPKNILEQNSVFVKTGDMNFDVINTVDFAKTNFNKALNYYYYDMALRYYLPVDQIPPRDEGFYIRRTFYARDDEDGKTPLSEARVGDVMRGRLEVITPKARNFVAIEDFIPAGVEIINFNLETSDRSLNYSQNNFNDYVGYGYGYGYYHDDGKFYPDKQETHDDRLFLFRERLEQGAYAYDYYVRALIPGKYHHMPAVASEMYFPENFGRTGGGYFTVKEK